MNGTSSAETRGPFLPIFPVLLSSMAFQGQNLLIILMDAAGSRGLPAIRFVPALSSPPSPGGRFNGE